MTTRRGFTLVELLVALVLLSIVGGVIVRLIATSQRLSRQQSEQVLLQGNVRTGALLVPSELRELAVSGTTTDIQSMGTSDITYRALRASGVACSITAGAPGSVRLRRSLYFGYRTLAASRDSLLIFMDDNADLTTDDRWSAFAVTGTPTTGTCPDGQPAIVVPTTIHADSLARMQLDAPVRSFEVMQLALFQQNTRYWLGARSVSADPTSTLQPVLGPLRSDGLQISYLAANGTATTVPTQVRTIEVMIRGLTQHTATVGTGGTDLRLAQDTLVTRIRLRNAPAL
jgi:prepilin-type N-terminal cleavage/methylation domain-containing protein